MISVHPTAMDDALSHPAFALELQQRWLVWDHMIDGRRRVDVTPLLLDQASHEEAIRVAEEAAALVFRAGDRAAADPVERARYRLHEDVERLAAAARTAGNLDSLVRVDVLLRADGRFVACEVNADCPGGYNETLALPRLARLGGFAGGHDPTTAAHRLADRLVGMSGGSGSPRGAIGLVAATAYAEDLQICALLERMVKERGGRAMRIPVTGPKADRAGGVSYRGTHLSVLYRYYPTEYMIGQANITALADATARGELAAVSSFSVIHAQSKLAMARAWAHEPLRANKVFPATSALRDVDGASLLKNRADWVVKRDLSRVGDHVVVGALETDASFRAALDAIAESEEDGEVWIAQRFIPPGLVPTPLGPRCLTLGVYLLDGKFVGYFARLSAESLCSHDALVVPVFVA